MQRFVAAAAMLLFSTAAFAAQNVANTSQKGSLLVWPLITVEQPVVAVSSPNTQQKSVLIEISNDATAGVHVECEYINERKGRVNFDFDLSAKQTASWDVYSRKGDQVVPPKFPTNTGNPPYLTGNAYRGELICFATNPGREFQISWNHLTGTATVITVDSTAKQPKHAFRYNAWAFAARGVGGVAAPPNVLVPHGRPGILALTGTNVNGVYDACPAYNIANFMPNGAELAGVTTIQNHLSVVSCWQDLRERYNINTTKLEFTVWNSHEHSFTGSHFCADSVNQVKLADPPVTAGSNFDYDVLQTQNARFIVRGVRASPPCPAGTRVSGLLGVLYSTIAIGEYDKAIGTADGTVGNTLHGAGLLPGWVLWDPSRPTPLRPQ